MAVAAGKDYAVARKVTWLFETGAGDATALVTRRHVFVFPHKTIDAHSSSTFLIDGRPPAQAILELLADPATTPEILDGQMTRWASQTVGPIFENFETFKRIRIFTGFFRRSVVFSKKEKGFEFGALGFRPKKEEMQAFLDLLKDYPALEIR